MPIYATRCKACDDRRDVLVPTTTSDLPKCSCGSPRERLPSAAAQLVFKGTGWYKPEAST